PNRRYQWFVRPDGRADRDLQLPALPLADVTPFGDRPIQGPPAHRDRLGSHDARPRDDRDLCRTGPDLADRAGAMLADGQSRADGRGQRLVDEPNLPGARRDRRFGDGAALTGGDRRRHGEHDLGPEEPGPAPRLAAQIVDD